MPKDKQQKKKERERRVAQEKLAASKKRAQMQTTEGVQTTSANLNKLTANSALPKIAVPRAKHSFNRPRSVG